MPKGSSNSYRMAALNVNEIASLSPHLEVGSEKEQVLVGAGVEVIEPTVASLGKACVNRTAPQTARTVHQNS